MMKTLEENRPVRVLLVDDHPMVRMGVELFLNSDARFEPVGQAGNGEEAIQAAQALQPDVICLDLVMPVLDGISAIERIRAVAPETQILALTSYIDLEKVLTAIRAGAAGYLMKDASPLELGRAIQAVARGEMYLHPEAARTLAQHFQPEDEQTASARSLLTQREEEVLKCVARGLNNQDIAEDMGISVKTVKAHLSNIMQKLNLENRVQAAIFALQHNIVSLEDL